jgi:Bacterial Ig-like domain (group 3)/FG-GAP-like repeat
MTIDKWLCRCGAAAVVAAILFSSVLCFANGTPAQSTGTAMAATSQMSDTSSAFLVAPAFPLGFAPSSVATGDLRRSGKMDLVAADYSSGKVTVFLGTGPGSFGPGATYDAGPHPTSIVVAEIAGDGKPGVLVANESEGTVSVLFGNGDGTLQSRQSYAVGLNPSFIAAGDFSGRGTVDVAVAGKSGSLVAILLNDGTGNLQKPLLYPLSKMPTALTAADFNNDGHTDLALANADGTVSLLLGAGAGLFHSLPNISVATGALGSIAAVDFNRDGKIDLVVTQPGQKLVSVLIGNGDGTFAPPASYPVGNAPVFTVVADVDHDGIADLLVINQASNTFSVLSGNGDGTFKAALDYVVGNTPLAAVAGDFSGNGNVDLAIINHSSKTVSVPSGNGDGTFNAARSYTVGVQPVAIASDDLNGDGRPDLVVANYCGADSACSTSGSVAVLLAEADGYRLASTYAVGAGPVSIALVDVNGDGTLDLITLNRLDKTVILRLGSGDGTFSQPLTFPVSGSPVAVATGDFNKDGNPDLAVLEDCGSTACSQSGEVEILLGSGDGNFNISSSYRAGFSSSALSVGALGANGNLDIVVANRCGSDASCQGAGSATVLRGDGSGNFVKGNDIALGGNPASIALGRLSSSGNLDIAVSYTALNTVAVLAGNGDGTFQKSVLYPVGSAPGPVVIADLNGDGNSDVAVANAQDSTVSVLFGAGDGTLRSAADFPVGNGPTALAAVPPVHGTTSLLATANGNIASASVGREITTLFRPQPNGVTANTVTLTVTPNTMTVNAPAPVTLNVTATGGSGTPTGTVTITSNGSPATVCSGLVLDGTGAASCTTSALQATVTTLTATYSGDTTYAIATGTASVTVNPLHPTVMVTPSPASPSPVNTNVTFTASLTGVGLTPTVPTGTFGFAVNGTTIPGCTSQPVSSAGVGSCAVSSLTLGSATVTATYSGDSNFVASAPGSANYTIQKATPTVMLTAAPSWNASLNAPVTFTATLTGSFTPIAPSGTVAFSAGRTPIAGCTAAWLAPSGANYVATCTTASLPTGNNLSIEATYSGDSNFNLNVSAVLPYTITALNPTVTVTPTPASPSPVNTNVTFTAALTGVALTPTVPSGTMTFALNGTTVPSCTGTVSSSGVKTCAIQNMPAGVNTITVAYAADPNFVALAPGSANYTTTALHPTISFVTMPPAPASPSALNTNVTFTATLAGTSLSPVLPSGTVTFALNGTTVPSCTGAVNSSGVKTCAIQNLPAGSNAVTATYSGDTSYIVAAPGSAPYTTTALPGTLSLAPLPGSSVAVGTSVTFTATVNASSVAPVAPSGTVSFTINGIPSADCPAVKVNASQQATCTTRSLQAPADAIAATYSGDPNFTPVSGATFTEIVTKASPTVALTASPSPASVNQSVTFTATVPSPAGGTPTVFPSGNVTFTQGANTLCAPVVLSSAYPPTASCTYSFPAAMAAPGATVTATYSGDSNFNSGTPGVTSEIVNFSSTTTTVTSTPNLSSVNQSVAFTAIVTPAFSGTAVPQGTVMFDDATTSTRLCTVTVASNGAAVCNYTFASAGSHSITATFTASNSNFSGSVSAADSQTVAAGAVTVGLTSTLNPSTVNQAVTLAATVSAVNPGAAVPQGTVAYSDALAGTTLCTVPVASNGSVPTCTVPMFLAGAHTITAAFTSANSNFQPGSSNGLNQVVGRTATTTTVVASPSAASSVNQPVTFTATVTPGITAFSGATNPTGGVTFSYTLGRQTGFLCTSAIPLSTAGSVTSAVCTASLPSKGTYTISATYAGDHNFQGGSPATLTQTVDALATTVSVTSQPSSPVVNQAVSFTAVITPALAGSTEPTGTVTFTDTLTGTQLCSTTVSAGVVPPCSATLLTAATHTISAAYSSGDSNFTGATSAVFNQPVLPAPTKVVVVSSLPTSVAAQPVTFTAVVTPTPTGTTVPTGAITFSSADNTLNTSCGAVPVTANGNGTATASCTVQFPLTASGQINVAASYSSDANFTASSGPAAQTIQNFAVAFSLQNKAGAAVSAPVLLTQGYFTIGSSPTDPFSPVQISVVSTPVSGFVDPLNVTCMVTNTATMMPVSDPACSPFTAVSPGSGSLTYILSASSGAAVGQYSVTLTATDSKNPLLSHSTAPLHVYIIGVANSLSLAQGATGTGNAVFNTATSASGTPPATLNSFSCGTIVNVADGSQIASGLVTCSGPSGSTAVTGAQTKVPITVQLVSSTVAVLRRSTPIYGMFFGLPLLALVGWFGGKKSSRRNFFASMGLILLAVALSCTIGCGGSATPPVVPPSGGLSAGSYLVQVVATDQNGAKYYAVVPLVVSSK